jgi:hypothetical protein
MARCALVFGVCLVACCWLAPEGLGQNEGLSNFGAHITSFLPYWAGLWSLALGTWIVARSRRSRVEQVLLRSMSVLVAVVVFTSANLGVAFNTGHVLLGSAAFTIAMLISLYATLRPSATVSGSCRAPAYASLAAAAGAWGLAGWWLLEIPGHLIWAQVGFLVAFLGNAMTWLRGATDSAPVGP